MKDGLNIEKSTHHDLATGAGEGLASFFVPGDIDRAFRDSEFAVSEMVEILTDIARATAVKITHREDGSTVEEPTVTPRERMAALQMLDKKAKEAMILGGLIQHERLQLKKTGDDGTEAEYNAEGMRLTREGSSRLQSTMALLESATKSTDTNEVIDVETQNDGSTSATGTGSGSKRSRGDGVRRTGHNAKRADSTDPQGGKDDNQGGIQQVARNHEPKGIEKDRGVGDQGVEYRSGNLGDNGPLKRPFIPGANAAQSAADRRARNDRARQAADNFREAADRTDEPRSTGGDTG